MRNMEQPQTRFMRMMEQIPTQGYLGLAMGSILTSAVLYLMGKRTTALFVGQWPPTFAAFALVYKLLNPSRERPIEQVRQAGEQARETVQDVGSRYYGR
jgi:hypothetical protein